MAQLRTLEDLEQERLDARQQALGEYPIEPYTKRVALLYSRYSTSEQVKQSVRKGLEQSSTLIARAIEYGWTRDLLIIFLENKIAEDGRVRSVSGTIPIEKRGQLSTVINDYVSKDKAGAIFVDDVSRLTRDADLVDATLLARECKKHDVIIVTTSRVYNFRRDGDLDSFIDEAKAAASWLKTHLHGKMLKNRDLKVKQGKLGNGVAPVGLMRHAVLDPESSPLKHVYIEDSLIPSPHAGQVAWLHRRFRELAASKSALLAELAAMAHSGKPIFPVVDGIREETIYLTRVEKDGVLLGWTIASRYGLENVLGNPAYQGMLVWNGRIIKRDAWDAIVDPIDWQYAFDHIAPVSMDNHTIERQATKRFSQKDKTPNTALLAGCRHDGRPVIDGVGDTHVFVNVGKQMYQIETRVGKYGATSYESGISICELDDLVNTRLQKAVARSEQKLDSFKAGYTRLHGVGGHHNPVGLLDQITTPILDAMEQVEQVQPPVPAPTLANIDAEIKQLDDDLNMFGKIMDATDRGKAYEKLARLRQRKASADQDSAREAAKQEDIAGAKEDIKTAQHQYNSWDLEHKRRFIRVVTDSIVLEEIADGWLRCSIMWSSLVGGLVDHLFIWRAVGHEWTTEEVARLHALYPRASRNELLQAFPTRSFTAITRKAITSSIRRLSDSEQSTIPNNTSLSDYQVIEKYGVQGGKRIQWVLDQVTNSTDLS
jgi:hypothetical protein